VNKKIQKNIRNGRRIKNASKRKTHKRKWLKTKTKARLIRNGKDKTVKTYNHLVLSLAYHGEEAYKAPPDVSERMHTGRLPNGTEPRACWAACRTEPNWTTSLLSRLPTRTELRHESAAFCMNIGTDKLSRFLVLCVVLFVASI